MSAKKTYDSEMAEAEKLRASMVVRADKAYILALESVEKAYNDALSEARQCYEGLKKSAGRTYLVPEATPRMRYKWVVKEVGYENTPEGKGVADTRGEAERALEVRVGPLGKFIREVGLDGRCTYYRPFDADCDVLVGSVRPVEEDKE